MLTPLCLANWRGHDALAELLEAKDAINDIFAAAFLADCELIDLSAEENSIPGERGNSC